MHARRVYHVLCLLVLTVACGGDATSTDGGVKLGVWGSADADLTATETSARIDFDASGCVGSFADIAQRLPAGSFALSGSFTRLMGAYPGYVSFPAQITGSVSAHSLTITVVVPDIAETHGPFVLNYGTDHHRMHCLYP